MQLFWSNPFFLLRQLDMLNASGVDVLGVDVVPIVKYFLMRLKDCFGSRRWRKCSYPIFGLPVDGEGHSQGDLVFRFDVLAASRKALGNAALPLWVLHKE